MTLKAQLTHGTKVPSPALMIIGAIVATASMVINYTTSSYRFTLFIIAGIGLFAWGTIKTFSEKPVTPKPVRKVQGDHSHKIGIQHGHRAVSEHAKRLVSAQRASQYHYCPYCATRIPPHSHFCPGCGQRLPA